MIIIQLVVIITAVTIIYYVLRSINSHTARAWKKIFLILLALAMIIAVLFPDITNRIANFVGVGRGADLLLYVLTLGFILYVLNTYIKHQDDKDKLYRVARLTAIIDANERYKISLNNKNNKRKP